MRRYHHEARVQLVRIRADHRSDGGDVGAGRTYQYANNQDKANEKVEADKKKLYGDTSALESLAGSASTEGSTSYVDLLLESAGADSEESELAVFKDVTFGGKSILELQGIDDPRKIKPFTVTTGRLTIKMVDGYKLKQVEVGALADNGKGELEYVYTKAVSGGQVTLSSVGDGETGYAPTQFKVTCYSKADNKNREIILTIYSEAAKGDG